MKSIAEVDEDLVASMRAYLESYSSHLPVRRVTAIGNAPLAPSRERSDLIDSSDLVFRVNSFVLDEPGDEPCLGTKTDVVVTARVTRITPWFFRDYPSRAYLVVDIGNARHPADRMRQQPLSWPDDLAAWPISNRVFSLPLKQQLRPETDGRGAVPTSGTLSAHVAHELFPEAELYLTGYSYFHDREQTEWAHHWGTVARVGKMHMLDREGALLQSWVDEGSAHYIP